MSSSAQRPLVDQVRNTLTEILLLALAGAAGLSVLFAATLLGLVPNPNEHAWAAVVSGPILLGPAGLTYLAIERLLAAAEGPVRPMQPPHGRPPAGVVRGVLIALGAIVLATGGSIVIAAIQTELFSVEVEEQEAITRLVEQGDPFALTMLAVSAVIFAPLTEELVFRHMFFRRLHQRAGAVAAWTLPAIAFALIHGNLVGLLVYAWLATVFAGAYRLTGRYWVAVLVHAGHNGFTVAALLLAPELAP